METYLKSVEIRLRKLMYNSRQRGVATPVATASPIFTPENVKRVLFLRQDRIGDVLVSIPIIRELKRVLPDARFDIVLGRSNRTLALALSPWISGVYVYEKSPGSALNLIRSLREKPYDLVIDLMDNPSATSTMLTKWARARHALGIDKENRHVYSHVVPLLDKSKYHIIQRLGNLLLPFNLNPNDLDLSPEFPLSIEQENAAELWFEKKKLTKKVVGVNICASTRNRYWGTERFVDFLNKVITKNKCQVVLFGTPDYSSELSSIAMQTGALVSPFSGFSEFAALIKQCDYIVTPDTSVVHVAAAFKIPTLVFYIHDNPSLMPWYPYNSPYVSLDIRDRDFQSMSVASVSTAFDKLLKMSGSAK